MNDLEQLRIVAQARYDQQQQAFAQIIQQEADLRAELTRLAQLNQSVEEVGEDIGQMQAIGADILWRGWLSRSITALNTELARVLARKAREQDRVRQAFGKLTALNELIDQRSNLRRKNRAQAGLSDAILHALWKNRS